MSILLCDIIAMYLKNCEQPSELKMSGLFKAPSMTLQMVRPFVDFYDDLTTSLIIFCLSVLDNELF